jgi:hypothetical protein
MQVNRRHQEPPLGLELRLSGPVRDEELLEPIREDHLDAKGISGAPRSHAGLQRRGGHPHHNDRSRHHHGATTQHGRCEGASAHKRGKLWVESNMASYGIDAHGCRADREEEEWVEAR